MVSEVKLVYLRSFVRGLVSEHVLSSPKGKYGMTYLDEKALGMAFVVIPRFVHFGVRD